MRAAWLAHLIMMIHPQVDYGVPVGVVLLYGHHRAAGGTGSSYNIAAVTLTNAFTGNE